MSVDTSNGHPSMDYAEHTENLRRVFCAFTKYVIIFLVVLLAGMKIFLV